MEKLRDALRRVPFWEEMIYTPAVFVRVANKGVAGYGEWKIFVSVANKGDREDRKTKLEIGNSKLGAAPTPHPHLIAKECANA
jgi:hypothetical protein